MSWMFWLWSLLTGSRLKASLLEGRRLLNAGEHLKALEMFRQVEQEWPNSPEGYAGMAQAYEAMGLKLEAKREATIAQALETMADNPDDIPSRVALARAYLEKEMYGWAAAHADHAIKIAPNHPEVMEVAIAAYTRNRNYDKAVKVLRRAIQKDPLQAELYEKLSHNLRAIRQVEQASKAAAVAEALRAVDQEPGNPEVVDRAVRNFLIRGQRELAQKLVERCLQSNPDVAGLHRLRGELLLLARKPQEAIEALSQAIRLDATDAKAHQLISKAYQGEGDTEKAEHHATLAKIIKDARESSDPLEAGVALVRVLIDSGNLEKAQAEAEALIKKNPQDWRSPFLKGLVLKAQGDLPKALAAFQQARRQNDNAALIHLEIALILSEIGDPVEAIGEARKAVNLSPRDPAIRLALVGLLRTHGYMDQAIEEEEIIESLLKKPANPR